ncbi:hypothetical protein [Methylobacterium persicinum]|uniref:DUF2218 domain-containing protein n=1 Tax=Methylobacterium persicinum TaxID=374426 RepID=A0ABU0HK23_9HYPH|nr:hypothetical protein [Methylobacterium persicinum]MDQ0441854.1 hypothetical protein [Methylobacterium persicinum]GJE38036.1 hypothetical protein KHHGKMAE_2102 [Methylobacterium persicinum]
MTPAEIEAKVRGAHVEALRNRFMQRHRSPRITDLFRDVRLYGREAGVDFAETHLGRLVDEAVGVAGCRECALEMTLPGSGRAALEGMAQALRDLTGLEVEVDGTTVRLSWA